MYIILYHIYLCLPGAPFFGFCLKQHLFWSLLEKTLLPPKNVLAQNDQE